ncbi:MAG: hypothetical protein AB7D06_14820 [Pedobacter sp.]
MFGREYISLLDLAMRWECSIENILEIGSSHALNIYTFIYTNGNAHFSYDESERVSIEGIYALDKNSLLKVLFKKSGPITVEDKIFQPTCEEDEEYYTENQNYKNLQVNSYYYNWKVCRFDFNFDIEDLFLKMDEVEAYEDFMEIVPRLKTSQKELYPKESLPKELSVALEVFEEFWQDRPLEQNPAPEHLINQFIKEKMGGKVSSAALDRIRTIARPDYEKCGGAPKSEAKYYRGRSQNPSA